MKTLLKALHGGDLPSSGKDGYNMVVRIARGRSTFSSSVAGGLYAGKRSAA